MWLLAKIALHVGPAFVVCTAFLTNSTDVGDRRDPNPSRKAKGALLYSD